MKKTIKLNECELHKLISESVMRVINEELDEKFIIDNLRDSLGAIGDTFRYGGGYVANKANRNYQTAKSETQNLMNKYGIQNGENMAQAKKRMTQDRINDNNTAMNSKIQELESEKQRKIEQIEQQYDAKIQSIQGKFSGRNYKINQKAQNYLDKYKNKKQELDAIRNNAYKIRRDKIKNPYAHFKNI